MSSSVNSFGCNILILIEKRKCVETSLKFNINVSAHYRVDYDEKTWNLIGEALINEPSTIHYLNRAQVSFNFLFLVYFYDWYIRNGYIAYYLIIST